MHACLLRSRVVATKLCRYKALPAWIRQAPNSGTGKYNYTLKDLRGRSFQVHLRERAFYITKMLEGTPFLPAVGGSPMVSWGGYATFDEAWAELLKKLGGSWDQESVDVD